MATLVAQALRNFRSLFRPAEPLPPITFSSLNAEAKDSFRMVCRRVCRATGRTYTDDFAEAFYPLYSDFSNAVVEAAYDGKAEGGAIKNALGDEAIKKAVASGIFLKEEIPIVVKVVWNRVAPDCW